MDKITLVTCFIDINRNEWNNRFKRTAETYLKNFEFYVEMKEDIIVFIDSRHHDYVKKLSEKKKNMMVIKIDKEFLEKNIKAWSYIGLETYAMNSDFYRTIINSKEFPENNIPIYNIVQHCKLDFVKYVIDNNLTENEIVCWSDFGYISQERFIDGEFDIEKFDKKRVNLCVIEHIPIIDDIIDTLIFSNEILAGTFYGGTKENMLKFREIYNEVLLKEFYHNDIVDDDQHIMLRCYLADNNLFRLNHTGWKKIHLFFKK